MSLDGLLQALEENPDLEASTETLLPFVDGPEFFERFIEKKGYFQFRVALYQKEGSLLNVIEKNKEFFRNFIDSKYTTLNDIKPHRFLASALGVENRQKAIAKALVERGFMSPEMPDGHSITEHSGPNQLYVDSEVVGEEQAERNIRKYLQTNYNNLDDVGFDNALASALGVEKKSGKIAKALVERGFMSPEMPDGHGIGKAGGISLYISPEVVGKVQAEKNLKKYILFKYKTLDDVRVNWALAATLSIEKNRKHLIPSIAKTLVDRGFISPELPDGHPISNRSHLTWYITPEVVGKVQAESNLRKYVQATYKTLDDVRHNSPLASALSVEEKYKTSAIVKSLIEKGIMSPEIPEGHSIGRAWGTWYLNLEIVGEEQAERNLRRYVQATYGTLDDVRKHWALASALGVKNIVGEVVRVIVEKGFMSPELPDGHGIGGSQGSFYLDSEIVGYEQAERNLRRYVQATYGTLDDVGVNWALASALGVEKLTGKIAKALVERGFMSPEMPDGHSILKGGRLSWYLNPEVVGEEQTERNIWKYIQAKYMTLDDVVYNYTLALVLGVENRQKAIVKTLVDRGFISPELPDGHPISKGPRLSFYIDTKVVREEKAEENLRKYVQAKYRTLEDVRQNPALASALGVYNKKTAIVAELLKRGYLKGDGFRSWSSSSLPEQFERKTITRKSKKKLKEIGAYTQPKEFHSTKFVKGEAFEQLVGFFLAYANPDELVIPQFCLDMRESYFGTRVDFRVGNALYEVKWGYATENIMETYARHRRLIDERHASLDYHLIRLERNGNGIEIDVPYQMFGSFTEGSEVGQSLRTLADILRKSSEDWNNIREVEFLTHFRDFIYNVIDTANSKKGEERKDYIRIQLETLVSLKDKKSELDAYMKENTDRYFAHLEAHFEYESQLYRGFVIPKQLQEEQSDRYSTIFYFGDIEFTNELDRNIAVMIECSADVKRIEKVLKNPRKLQTNPLFRVNDKLRISTNGHPNAVRVSSLDELKGILSFENDMYEFGREYISTHGNMC